MSLSTPVVIGILFFAFAFITRVLPRLVGRQAGRSGPQQVGDQAMGNVPEQIQFTRAASPQWKDESAMQRQAAPLVRAGFNDLGTFGVDTMPGVLIRILFQPQTYVSTQICEHPRTEGWVEFATRYTDGSSDSLTTLANQGIVAPPFVRTRQADKDTPTDRLYQQHLEQRQSSGIKPLSPNEVVRETEDAYTRYRVWMNSKGRTPEEIAQATVKWVKSKRQAAGQ